MTTKYYAFLFGALILPAIVGCVEVKRDVKTEAGTLVKGPEEAAFRTITDFTPALRCMDSLMIKYGIHDVSMMIEDIRDNTKKVKAGAKDMVISAVSEMTRRSHAIRLIAFGNDSGNLVSFLATAENRTAYSVIPSFDIRGSISQLDKSIAAKDVSAGLSISDVGIGGAKTANASVLAIDLSVISTQDYSVIPGVVSKNSVVILKEGKGLDADASINKFGLNFSMNLTRSEGDAQALRNLLELGVIELLGKLTRTPYWSCLGVDSEREEIKNEIYDWFYTLAADNQIVAYFQAQLSNRGFYQGAIDGVYNEELTEAIFNYRRGLNMGLAENGDIDLKLFTALLNRPVPVPPAPSKSVSSSKPAAEENVQLTISYADANRSSIAPGELLQLIIRPEKDTHVFCYFEDENRRVQRFFPNRFLNNSVVTRSQPLELPGGMPFKLYASKNGASERLVCFTSPRNILRNLPGKIKGSDFENLEVKSLEAVQAEFENILGKKLGGSYFEIKAK